MPATEVVPSRWLALSLSLAIASVSGTAYAFGLYSDIFKRLLGYNQSELAAVGTAGDIGLYCNIVAGFLIIKLGPRLTGLVGGSLYFIGYLCVWLLLYTEPPHSVIPMAFFHFVAHHGSGWLAVVATVCAASHFPMDHRGKVIGMVKCFLALSTSIMAQYYNGFFRGSDKQYLTFLPIYVCGVAVLCSLGVSVGPESVGRPSEKSLKRDNKALRPYIIVGVSLAVFLAVRSGTQAADELYPWLPPLSGFVIAAHLVLVVVIGVVQTFRDEQRKRVWGARDAAASVSSAGISLDTVGAYDDDVDSLDEEEEAGLRSIASLNGSGSFSGTSPRERAAAASLGATLAADHHRNQAYAASGKDEEAAEFMPLLLKDDGTQPASAMATSVWESTDLLPPPVAEDFSDTCFGITRILRRARFPPNVPTSRTVATLDFWLMFGAMFSGTGCGLVIVNNLDQMISAFHEVEETPSSIRAQLVTIFGLANFLGRLGMGALSDALIHRITRPGILFFDMCLMVVPMSLLTLGDPAVLALSVALAGVSFGGVFVLNAAIVADLFGMRHLGSNYGALDLACGCGAIVLATVVAGRDYDAHTAPGESSCFGAHCFAHTFYICLYLLCTGVVMSFVLWRRATTQYAVLAVEMLRCGGQ
eukprot:Rmarinus@m.26646